MQLPRGVRHAAPRRDVPVADRHLLSPKTSPCCAEALEPQWKVERSRASSGLRAVISMMQLQVHYDTSRRVRSSVMYKQLSRAQLTAAFSLQYSLQHAKEVLRSEFTDSISPS